MYNCTCNLFRLQGECYHTGWRPPDYADLKRKKEQDSELPAIRRMKNRVKGIDEIKEERGVPSR